MGLAPARRPAFFRLVLREASIHSFSEARPVCGSHSVAGITRRGRFFEVAARRGIRRDEKMGTGSEPTRAHYGNSAFGEVPVPISSLNGTASRQVEKLTRKIHSFCSEGTIAMFRASSLQKASSRRKGRLGNSSTTKNGSSVHHRRLVCEMLEERCLLSSVTLSIGDNPHIAKPRTGEQDSLFSVSLSAASTSKVTVSYNTADGTATGGSDYATTTNGTLEFEPGETRKTIRVPIYAKAQSNETFLVNLSSPVNATIAKEQGIGTIKNSVAEMTVTVKDTHGNSLIPFVGDRTIQVRTDDNQVYFAPDFDPGAIMTLATANDVGYSGKEDYDNLHTYEAKSSPILLQVFSSTGEEVASGLLSGWWAATDVTFDLPAAGHYIVRCCATLQIDYGVYQEDPGILSPVYGPTLKEGINYVQGMQDYGPLEFTEVKWESPLLAPGGKGGWYYSCRSTFPIAVASETYVTPGESDHVVFALPQDADDVETLASAFAHPEKSGSLSVSSEKWDGKNFGFSQVMKSGIKDVLSDSFNLDEAVTSNSLILTGASTLIYSAATTGEVQADTLEKAGLTWGTSQAVCWSLGITAGSAPYVAVGVVAAFAADRAIAAVDSAILSDQIETAAVDDLEVTAIPQGDELDVYVRNLGNEILNVSLARMKDAQSQSWSQYGVAQSLDTDDVFVFKNVPKEWLNRHWNANGLDHPQIVFDAHLAGKFGQQHVVHDTIDIMQDQAQFAIGAGIDWLRTQQRQGSGTDKGSWSNDSANTAMAVLAMLNAGYKETDSAVSDGIAFIRRQIKADGSVRVNDTKDDPGTYTYRTAIAILPLAATHNGDYRDDIVKLRSWLIGAQLNSGVNTGGFGYAAGGRADLSNTQWALMGLKAADRELKAADSEFVEATTTYNQALIFLDRCRNAADGGSAYTPGGATMRTMTAASVWSYSLCGIAPDDYRVKGGSDWLERNYSVTNTGGAASSEYYYKVTLAKALVMSRKVMLGDHDWFADVSAALIKEQNKTVGSSAYGSWPDVGMAGADMSTAWALLALQASTLPAGADLSMSMILKSHADLHVYDPTGNHLGVNYVTAALDQDIPGATLKYYLDANHDGIYDAIEEKTPSNYLDIPVEWVQVATLPQLVAGSYRTELVGTSDGTFDLEIEGNQDGTPVPGGSFAGSITVDDRLASTVTVTAMEGALTLIVDPLAEMPTMEVVPANAHVYVAPGATVPRTFEVKETGGNMMLHSVSIYATDFVGPWGTIPGSSITFDVNDFDVAAGATQVVTASYPVPGDFEGSVSGTIVVESTDGGTKSIAVTIESNPLYVTGFTPAASGFTVQFNRAIDPTVLNLYDSESHVFGASDVVVKDSANKVVPGTLLVIAPDQIQFVATGGVLAAGTYTVTLRSATDGFKDQVTGQLLDGEYSGTFPSGDGTPGGNFVYDTFAVAAPKPIVVSLPDFARGPGQRVNVPSYDPNHAPPLDEDLNQAGLPIRLSNANGVTSLMLMVKYDPALLTITDVLSGLVPGTRTSDNQLLGSVVYDLSTPGQVGLLFYTTQPLTGTNVTIARLSAMVPESADSLYGSAGVLHIASVSVNGSTDYATADDAVEVVALPGDANMNGVYDDQDASLIARVAAGLDNGFAATPPWPNPVIPGTTTPLTPTATYPLIDPLILGDITGNGTISGLDASYVAEKALYEFEGRTTNVPFIPPLRAEITNHAPVLDNSGTVILPTISEDNTDPAGISVQDLIASSVRPVEQPVLMITDPDSGALKGIAITGLTDTNGTWQFNTGTGWTDLGPVSDTSALLLRSTDLLRFAPDGMNGSADTITFRAWDQTGSTSGQQGTKFDASVNGGSSPFSTAWETASIIVAPVNDAPVVTVPGTQTVNEDTDLYVTGMAVSDVDAANDPIMVTLTTTHGILTLRTDVTGGIEAGEIVGNGTGAITVTSTVAKIDATLGASQGLKYRGSQDYNGPDSLTVTANDQGHNGLGSPLSDTKTVAITVNAVNDAPVQTGTAPSPINVNEDSANTTAVTLGMGGLAYGNGGGSDESGQTLTYTVTAIPAFATIWKSDGTTQVTPGTVLTLVELQGLKYKTVPDANGSGNLIWTVVDNGSGVAPNVNTLTETLALTVNAVNDAPVQTGTAPSPINVNEDSANTTAVTLGMGGLAYGNGGGSDESGQTLTYTVTAIPAFATIWKSDGTTQVTPGTVLTLVELQGLKYKTVPDANGSGNLIWTVVDNGSGVAPNVNTLTETLALTVNAVNDAPVQTGTAPSPINVNEDSANTTAVTLGMGGLAYGNGGGSDESGQTLTYTVTAIPSFVTIWKSDGTTQVTAGTAVTLAELQGLKYKTVPDANGSGNLTWTVGDSGSGVAPNVNTLTETLALTVNAVNDAPVQTGTAPSAINVNEDSANATAVTLGMGGLAYGNGGGSDESGQTLTYTVTAIPSFVTIWKSDGTTQVTAGTAVMLVELQGLKYKTVLNANGSDNLTWTVVDSGSGVAPNVNTLMENLSLTVNAVNDAPVQTGTAPSAINVNEDSADTTAVTLGMSGLAYGNGGGSDESGQTLTYTVTAIPAFATIWKSDGTTQVTAGTAVTLAELQGLKYKTVPDANGSGNLTWTVVDSGSGAAPNVNTLTETLALTVNAVNDAPTAADGTVTMSENADHVFVASEFHFSDVDTGDTLSAVQITTLATNGALKWNGVLVVANQEVTRADIDAGKLMFKPFVNESGTPYATFGFKVKDTGGPIFSASAYTISANVNATLLAAGGQASGTPDETPLSQTDSQPIVNEAIARWAAAGLSAQVVDSMAKVKFLVNDLPGAVLGLAGGDTIYLDRDAAGYGWFVDPTPAKDEEFARLGSGDQLQASDSGVIDRMDLLSVVEHELGHLAGLGDLDWSDSGLMSGLLGTGIRRNATPKEVEAVFAAGGGLTM